MYPSGSWSVGHTGADSVFECLGDLFRERLQHPASPWTGEATTRRGKDALNRFPFEPVAVNMCNRVNVLNGV